MRAIVVQEYGGPEVLQPQERPEPRPGPGEITILVAYAGVNFADLKARESGYRVPALPFVPGLEVSGRIRAVGEGVTGLAAGQPVTAMLSGGGYADVAVARAALTLPVPDGLDLPSAASLITVLPTAYALVHDVARIRSGESILIQSAAGGVGTVAGQVARLAGAAAVYGVVSRPEKVEYALGYGYDEVFLEADFDERVRQATGGRGVDVVLDPVGGETWRRGLASLAVFGRAVAFGNASGAKPWAAGLAELAPRSLGVHGFSILSLAAASPERLRVLAGAALRLATEGRVRVPITAEFPLEQAAEAHRLIGSRTSTGKILLQANA